MSDPTTQPITLQHLPAEFDDKTILKVMIGLGVVNGEMDENDNPVYAGVSSHQAWNVCKKLGKIPVKMEESLRNGFASSDPRIIQAAAEHYTYLNAIAPDLADRVVGSMIPIAKARAKALRDELENRSPPTGDFPAMTKRVQEIMPAMLAVRDVKIPDEMADQVLFPSATPSMAAYRASAVKDLATIYDKAEPNGGALSEYMTIARDEYRGLMASGAGMSDEAAVKGAKIAATRRMQERYSAIIWGDSKVLAPVGRSELYLGDPSRFIQEDLANTLAGREDAKDLLEHAKEGWHPVFVRQKYRPNSPVSGVWMLESNINPGEYWLIDGKKPFISDGLPAGITPGQIEEYKAKEQQQQQSQKTFQQQQEEVRQGKRAPVLITDALGGLL
jgi:hypothetical protein